MSVSDRYEQDRERFGRDRGQEYDRSRQYEGRQHEGRDYESRGNEGRQFEGRGFEGREDWRSGRSASPQFNQFHRDFDRDYNQEGSRQNYFGMGGPNQGGRYEDQNDWSSRRGSWSGAEGQNQGQNAGRYAAGGSYYGGASEFGGGMGQYGEQGRHAGRGPKGYKRSDERIREDVSEQLTRDPWVDATEIEIEVREGEITLTGVVHTRDEKRRAEDAIERVSGVRDIHNQIRVQQHEHAMAGQGSVHNTGQSSGSQTAGSQTAGSQTAGSQNAGTQSAGAQNAGPQQTSKTASTTSRSA